MVSTVFPYPKVFELSIQGLRKKADKLEATRLRRLQAKEDKQAEARARNLPLPSAI